MGIAEHEYFGPDLRLSNGELERWRSIRCIGAEDREVYRMIDALDRERQGDDACSKVGAPGLDDVGVDDAPALDQET